MTRAADWRTSDEGDKGNAPKLRRHLAAQFPLMLAPTRGSTMKRSPLIVPAVTAGIVASAAAPMRCSTRTTSSEVNS
jgi:hypothetical protein